MTRKNTEKDRSRDTEEAAELETEKHCIQSRKRERRLTNASGALRQAQGPGYGGFRPSFPRMRESRDTSCKEWIPALPRG